MDNADQEAYENRYLLGMYKLRADIIDERYVAPLDQLKRYTKKRSPDHLDGSLDILWWILFCIVMLLHVGYGIGAYCLYFSNSNKFD